MVPALQPGDHVFVDPSAAYATGDIVVARHPFKAGLMLVKRVGAVGDDGTLELLSDNPVEGTDSRTLGRAPESAVIGRVVARL